jgi:hypothetical protein
MARGRFVSRSISTDEDLWALGHEAVLLFDLMLPHQDRDGRMRANPRTVRATVAPLSDWSADDVERILLNIATLRGVQYYEDRQGRRYVQFDNFYKHQAGFKRGGPRYLNEPVSECPDPTDADCHPVGRKPDLRVASGGDDIPF